MRVAGGRVEGGRGGFDLLLELDGQNHDMIGKENAKEMCRRREESLSASSVTNRRTDHVGRETYACKHGCMGARTGLSLDTRRIKRECTRERHPLAVCVCVCVCVCVYACVCVCQQNKCRLVLGQRVTNLVHRRRRKCGAKGVLHVFGFEVAVCNELVELESDGFGEGSGTMSRLDLRSLRVHKSWNTCKENKWQEQLTQHSRSHLDDAETIQLICERGSR
jgi:hypothetical protein